jgi:hypothetical protein
MIRILFTLVALILTLLSACRCATPPAPPAKVVEDAGVQKVEDAAVKAAASAPASAPAAVKK